MVIPEPVTAHEKTRTRNREVQVQPAVRMVQEALEWRTARSVEQEATVMS